MNEMRSPEADDPDACLPADFMTRTSEILMEQSLTLNEMFLELTRSAVEHQHQWPGATKDYVRLALRAQANCRASLTAMAHVERTIRARDAGADTDGE